MDPKTTLMEAAEAAGALTGMIEGQSSEDVLESGDLDAVLDTAERLAARVEDFLSWRAKEGFDPELAVWKDAQKALEDAKA